MQLNHLHLTVTDVVATYRFFEKYFGLRGATPTPSRALSVLFDDAGLVLTLSRAAPDWPGYPDPFHIGFMQASPAGVNALNERLRADGFEVEALHHAHGAWTFYFTAPGGVTIEVLC